MVSRVEKANIFLTGPLEVGKSTLLRKVVRELGWRTGGFQTRPVFDTQGVCGFSMEPFEAGRGAPSVLMARRTDRGFDALPITFDGLGCSLLGKALEGGADLIVMDEIGFFESRAYRFHDAVMACLDSPVPVLGVLKKSEASLPRKIRCRPDVRVVEVSRENREVLLPDLVKLIRKEI